MKPPHQGQLHIMTRNRLQRPAGCGTLMELEHGIMERPAPGLERLLAPHDAGAAHLVGLPEADGHGSVRQ